jgi:hypothetical protein
MGVDAGVVEAGGRGGPERAPADRESRRRWALARMDDGAGRLCHERFREAADVRRCKPSSSGATAHTTDYIEASRD